MTKETNFKLYLYNCIQEVMKQLKDDQKMQMTRIKQLSDALNVCYDVKHGKGSVAEAEAEKLLLIASLFDLLLFYFDC